MHIWRDITIGGLLAAFFLVLPHRLSPTFPPVNVDEAFLANQGYNWVVHHNNRYSLYDDLFEPTLYRLRDATGGLLQVMFETWIGPFVAWLPKSLAHARLAPLAAAWVALVGVFLLGCRIQGRQTGCLCVVLAATHPLFIVAAALVRAEMVLLMAMTTILVLAMRVPDEKNFKYPLLGLLSGWCVGIHQNAIPVFMGLVAFCFFYGIAQKRQMHVLFLGLGFLLGVALVLRMIDLPKLWLTQTYGLYDLYKPPFLVWPWHPFNWLRKWPQLALSGQPTWYLPENGSFSWWASMGFYWVALGLLGGAGWIQTRRRAVSLSPLWRPTWAGLAGLYLGMCLWIRKDEALYTLLFLPYAVLLGGLAWSTLGRWKWRATLSSFCAIGISLFFFFRFVGAYQSRYLPYATLCQTVRQWVPRDAKLAAPAILWFDWPETQFRDLSALVGSRWLTGGSRDVQRWLSGWKPDVIVIEGSWKRMLLGQGDTQRLLQKALTFPVEPLGTLDTGSACLGVLEFYRLRWPDVKA